MESGIGEEYESSGVWRRSGLSCTIEVSLGRDTKFTRARNAVWRVVNPFGQPGNGRLHFLLFFLGQKMNPSRVITFQEFESLGSLARSEYLRYNFHATAVSIARRRGAYGSAVNDALVEQDAHYDAMYEIRCGEVETGLPCDFSRHYESKSVAAIMPDGTWVGWTYWYGGGKYGEPEAVEWMADAYDLECVEEEKVVTVRTFTKCES